MLGSTCLFHTVCRALDTLADTTQIQWVSWPGAVVEEDAKDGLRKKFEVGVHSENIYLLLDHMELHFSNICTRLDA